MRPYEAMVIFDADLDEAVIRGVVDRSLDIVRTGGGEPGGVDHWGKRRFAYELKHRWEGYYVVFQAQTEPAIVAELNRFLSLADEVLRHRVVTIPDHMYGKTRPPAPADT
jgi:small subunit ribosomal protein S6